MAENPEETLKKMEVAKEKKNAADTAFKAGDVQNALRAYHESLMYLKGLQKNAMQTAFQGSSPVDQAAEAKPKTEVDEMLEKIYSNMAACHIKQGNWRRAVETADKALAIDQNNNKALFRKAKALGEQGFFEKAEKLFEDLLKKDTTDGPAINAELVRFRAIDKEREKAYSQKFKGFLNRPDKVEKVSN